MASKQLNKFGMLLLLFPAIMFAQEQDTVQDAQPVEREMFLPHNYIALDAGADLASQPTIRFGFALATQERSCVLGSVAYATSIGISVNPSLNAYGLYFGRNSTIGLLHFGLRGLYETDLSHQWMALQPQVGLGLGPFRVTYNFKLPFFFGAREDFVRHTIGIAYTFNIAEWGSRISE